MPQGIQQPDPGEQPLLQEDQDILDRLISRRAQDEDEKAAGTNEFKDLIAQEVSPKVVEEEAGRKALSQLNSIANVGAAALTGGVPSALATSALEFMLAGGESKSQSRAGITGAATDVALSRAPGGRFIAKAADNAKEIFKKGAARTAISTAIVGAEQTIETLQEQQDIAGGITNSFFFGTLPEATSTALGVGAARILGPAKGSDITRLMARLRKSFPAFRKDFGLQIEKGGTGESLTDIFSATGAVSRGIKEQSQSLRSAALDVFSGFGGIGEATQFKSLRTPAGGKDIDTILKQAEKRITQLRPFQLSKDVDVTTRKESRRFLVESERFETKTVTQDVVENRALQSGDQVAINLQTGQILPNATKLPKGFQFITIDGEQLTALKKFVKTDPGGVAAAIGRDGENMQLVWAINNLMPVRDAEIMRRAWIQNLLSDSLEFRTKKGGGLSLLDIAGPNAQLEPDALIRLDVANLAKIWDDKNTLKAAMVLGKGDPVKGKILSNQLNDVMSVLRDLEVGSGNDAAVSSRIVSFLGNKLAFTAASAGAVGVASGVGLGALGPAAAGAVVGGALGFTALIGISGLLNLALLNPRTTTFFKAAAKGDRDASRALLRAAAKSGLFGVTVDNSSGTPVANFDIKSYELSVKDELEKKIGQRTTSEMGLGELFTNPGVPLQEGARGIASLFGR